MTYRLCIEYDGTDFHGWQIQPNGITIQESLEKALHTVLRAPTAIVGSGRTDAGVHARGQVAHFKTEQPIDPFRLRRSLNGVLPNSIAILSVDEADDAFHARYSARQRRYHYFACTAPRALDRRYRWFLRPAPNFDVMNEAARHLLGQHNFSAFCKTRSETENRICTIARSQWVAEERAENWRFEIVGDRFLHGMVRAIVGTLIEIGRDKRPATDLPRVLASQDRREAGSAAPAHGLVLAHVGYD